MNFDPKIINKIYKCSGKQHLHLDPFPCNNEPLTCYLTKIIKMADLNHILGNS